MKKLLLFSSLLANTFLFSQTWSEQFTSYPVSGTYTGDVSIIDANNVWAMAQRTTTTNHQRYSRTSDGGATWTSGLINVGNTTGLGIGNVTAVDNLTAFVSVFPTTSGLATQGVYKTTDGGTTWTRQTTAGFVAGSFVNFVHFWDTNNGVCGGDKLGGYFEIYTTTNGGTNWTRTPSANIATSTSNYGYTGKYKVTGNTIWFGTDSGELMKSTDKGLNWTKITTPVADFGGGTVTTTRAEFTFKDDNNGIIVKENYSTATTPVYLSLNVYKTVDGGVNWTEITPISGIFHGAIAYAGTSMLVSAGSSTGNFGTSYSLNDGTTWTPIDALSHTTLTFKSNTVGFGGGFGTTTTGGAFKFTNNLSTTNFKNNFFSVYPNPGNEIVNIESSESNSLKEISLIDLNGRTIKNYKFSNLTQTKLDVSDVNSGIYLLNIVSDNGTSVEKFIKN